MGEQRTIVLATGNTGKIKEIRQILGQLPVRLLTASEVLGVSADIEETGATFEQNAMLKARAVADLTGMASLADDSGLEVDALGGRPGVFSARYGGEDAGDEAKIAKLLGELREIEEARRTARFRCALCFVDPEMSESEGVLTADGACEGTISQTPRGAHGFGYDPVFFLPDVGVTMAELSPEAKNERSHRAAALRALLPKLREWVNR